MRVDRATAQSASAAAMPAIHMRRRGKSSRREQPAPRYLNRHACRLWAKRLPWSPGAAGVARISRHICCMHAAAHGCSVPLSAVPWAGQHVAWSKRLNASAGLDRSMLPAPRLLGAHWRAVSAHRCTGPAACLLPHATPARRAASGRYLSNSAAKRSSRPSSTACWRASILRVPLEMAYPAPANGAGARLAAARQGELHRADPVAG